MVKMKMKLGEMVEMEMGVKMRMKVCCKGSMVVKCGTTKRRALSATTKRTKMTATVALTAPKVTMVTPHEISSARFVHRLTFSWESLTASESFFD